jgi:hypothetical protein
MENLLYETIDYKIDETTAGTWKSFLGINGQMFREFTSHRKILGMPLVHYTYGRDPRTGRRKVARGFFAMGRMAIGVFPMGQLAIGVIPVGQVGLGLIFGLGQLCTGLVAIGQVAIGVFFGFGQIATGLVSIGQVAVGVLSLGQITWAPHGRSMYFADPIAKAFFHKWLGFLGL